jgi:hypothetical protein
MTVHGRAADYLDGHLTEGEESAFIEHVLDCAACEAALADELQLRDREEVLGEHACHKKFFDAIRSKFVDIIRFHDLAGFATVAMKSTVVAAAAAMCMLFAGADDSDQGPPIDGRVGKLTLASVRRLEPRLAYGPAADFRPYEVSRADSTTGERISPSEIAELEATRDCHGVAVALLLTGEVERAETHFGECGSSAGLDTDRAALALRRGKPEAALKLTDRVLADHPGHRAALWNRALALRDLGLGLAAAEDFERVAELETSGPRSVSPWADEARRHAAKLRGELGQVRDSWLLVSQLGNAMIGGGPPIPPALARQSPSRARWLLRHAIRAAPTRARLEELRALAVALDEPGEELVAAVDGAGEMLRPTRAALLGEYAAMVLGSASTEAARTDWFRRAHAARADDLVVAALVVSGLVGEALSATSHVGARAGELEIGLDLLAARAEAERKAGRLEAAAALLGQENGRCTGAQASYGCLLIAIESAQLELARYKPALARERADAALAIAEALGEGEKRRAALYHAAEAERYRRQTASALALYREYALASDTCERRRKAATLQAELLFDDHRLAEAHAMARSREDCERPATPNERILEADLLRAGRPLRPASALVADLEAARAAATPDGDEALLYEYLAARAALDSDSAAIQRLDHVAQRARTRSTSLAEHVLTAVESARLVAAGDGQDWAGLLAVAAGIRSIPVPERCALAIGHDDFRLAAVALGPRGEREGFVAADMPPSVAWTAPPRLRERLRGCETVDVLALPPRLGAAPPLDPATPWRYVLGAPRSSPPGPPHTLVVAAPRPPADLELPALAPWPRRSGPTIEILAGPAATPDRFAAAAPSATLIELHAHALRTPLSDAPLLALSPGRSGWALTAERVHELSLERAPVVILADCGAAVPAPYVHLSWSLPTAFHAAGARSVVASLVPVPDAEANSFFAGVSAAIESGTSAPIAVARERAVKIAADPTSWVRHVVVFE